MGMQDLNQPLPPRERFRKSFVLLATLAYATLFLALIWGFVEALLLAAVLCFQASAEETSKEVQTPYGEQKVVFDFYLDDPDKINSALFWIRSLINPLLDDPYGMAPEFLDIKVIIHGTEIVTVARKNYEKYRDAVERMRYYASLGVDFRICGLAAQDYDYGVGDFYDFIDLPDGRIGVVIGEEAVLLVDSRASHRQADQLRAELTTPPLETTLHQNFPNPFNPSTKIAYGLDRPAEVVLRILDARGREVAVMREGRRPTGRRRRKRYRSTLRRCAPGGVQPHGPPQERTRRSRHWMRSRSRRQRSSSPARTSSSGSSVFSMGP